MVSELSFKRKSEINKSPPNPSTLENESPERSLTNRASEPALLHMSTQNFEKELQDLFMQSNQMRINVSQRSGSVKIK